MAKESTAEPVVVAVDGGNSKTDVVALRLDGSLVGRASAGTTNPHRTGVDASIGLLDSLVESATHGHSVLQANVYLAGLDLEDEIASYRRALGALGWTSQSTVADNDMFALLRAGSAEPDSVAVVCGAGLNAVGQRADGATARFFALGEVSGDWGGGEAIARLAVWHAARAADRRGPATELASAIPRFFGLSSIGDVVLALHRGELADSDLGALAPLVFQLARGDDAVAASIVDRQATEVAGMAFSCLSRLDLLDRPMPVILGGGVIRSGDERLLAGIDRRLAQLAPLARTRSVTVAPLVGSALLALERVGARADALDRARAEVTA